MALPYAGDEPQKQSNEEKAKAIVNLFILETVVIIVSGAGYLYLSFVLDWDPVIAIIPVVIILLLSGSYTAWKVQKLAAEADIIAKQGSALSSRGDSPVRAPLVTGDKKKAKNDEPEKTGSGRKIRSRTLGIIGVLLFLGLIMTLIDYYDPDYLSKKVTSLVRIGLIIIVLVLVFSDIEKRAQDKPQPSEESYNAFLKHAIEIIVADVLISFGCFILGTMYGELALPLLFVVVAVFVISMWYLASKMRSLGIMS